MADNDSVRPDLAKLRARIAATQDAAAYERGEAISMASYLEIDGVIDPADTRDWIARGMDAMPVPTARARRFLDTW